MKINTRYFLTILLSAVLLLSCDDNEKGPKGKYETGLFIVNEGGFGKANGTISVYNTNTEEVEQNIFATESGFAGDVVQSLTFKDDKGYIVVNGDNKIQVVDANTFESVSTITSADFDKPRYVEVINDKAYISVWGKYSPDYTLEDSYVLVYDLKTNEVIKKIDTDEGTDNLLYNGQKLFASNNNFGGSSTLAVINPSDNSLIDQIELYYGPAGMALDANGKLWVITHGTYEGNDGKLFRINTSTLDIEQVIDLGVNPANDLAITADKKDLIYRAGKSVYKIAITATTKPEAQLFDMATDIVTPYSLSVDPATDNVYIGDAIDYSVPGKVYVYDATGTLKTSFGSGISPTQFVFK